MAHAYKLRSSYIIKDVKRSPVTIRDQILQKLHDSFSGLKEGYGLDWLDQTLTTLKELGFRRVVKGFLSNMHDLGNLPAYLLEVEFLDCLLRAGLDPGKIKDEHFVGGLTRPIDAAYENLPTFRADFQCKYINSYENELLVNELCHWIDTNFILDEPGSLLHIQASTEADKTTFEQFKIWLQVNRLELPFDKAIIFESESAPGSIEVERTAAKSPGTYVGSTSASAPERQYAVCEDIDLARKVILRRCEDSAPTFAYPPSASQHNVVVMGVDPLAMLDERQFFLALYGHETVLSDQSGKRLRDGAGLFDQGVLNFVSAVFLLKGSVGNYEVIVFSNPVYKLSMDFWTSLSGFRLGQQSRKPVID